MLILVDGHNLIPKLPGLSLKTLDDEMHLIELLQIYSRSQRKPVEVYFDGAPAGHAGTRVYGTVKAHFVRAGQTADDAIRRRLDSLGKQAKEVTVITSDHRVQGEAKAHQARFIPSEQFAVEMLTPSATRPSKRAEKSDDPALDSQEVEEWLRLFKKK
jgi:uncharacterized protein